MGFELATVLVVIGADYIGSYKSNSHTIMTTTLLVKRNFVINAYIIKQYSILQTPVLYTCQIKDRFK